MSQIKQTYYTSLSRLLNYSFFNKVYTNQPIDKEFDILKKCGLLVRKEAKRDFNSLTSELYQVFKKSYRCEYIYKNEIIKEIYLTRKEQFNEVIVLNEFRVNYSKADFLVLNGHSTIYEIKTDLDNIDRLEGQISDYLKIAQHVYIVTSPKFVSNLQKCCPPEVGIIVFNESGELVVQKEAMLNDNIDLNVVFSTLNNEEHKNIVHSKYGALPKINNTIFYETYLKLFREIECEEAYSAYINELKKRRKNRFNPIGIVPDHLLGIATNQKNMASIEEFMFICNKKFSFP